MPRGGAILSEDARTVLQVSKLVFCSTVAVYWACLLGARCCLVCGLQHVGGPAGAGGLLRSAVKRIPAHRVRPPQQRTGRAEGMHTATLTLLRRSGLTLAEACRGDM